MEEAKREKEKGEGIQKEEESAYWVAAIQEVAAKRKKRTAK
ncbi:hypothetical protein [Cytobacillus firmus]|nr:hypothetical protein [Cytobacillus firmus]